MAANPAAAHLQASLLLDENTLLALGYTGKPLPAEGQLSFGADNLLGRFTAVTWPGADDRHCFLACLQVEQMATLGLRRAVLTGPDGEAHPLPKPGRLRLEPGEMGHALAEAAGSHLAAVVAFLQGEPITARVLADLLATASSLDGFIEIFGRARDGELYLQGWSNALTGGDVELLFETSRCRCRPALIATYLRPDLMSPAHGIAAVVGQADGLEPRDVRRVYYRRGDTYFRLEVYENRLMFGDVETSAHAAAMLPQLQADAPVQAALKRLAAPRYQGHETLSTLPLPVRAALDMAVWVPGEGVFLAGWLLDPEGRVKSVTFGATCGRRLAVEARWTRSQRPDVSQGYSQDPLFAGRIQHGDDGHGFAVYAPCPDPEPGEMYVEIELVDGQVGFLPIHPRRPGAADVRRILMSFDINHPDIDRLIDLHVGPTVSAIGRQCDRQPRSQGVYEFGPEAQAPRVSVVLPVPPGRADIDVTMARLAVEPAVGGVELVVVGHAPAIAQLGPLLPRQARFYGLSGRVVTSDGGDVFDAMMLGAATARADLLLFLGASVLPRQTGWLGQLERLLNAAPRAAAISPTLLYEDLSVRFAGSRANGWAPPANIGGLTRYRGYSRHWLAAEAARIEAAVPVHAIAHECCLIRRAPFEAVGGFSADLVGPAYKSFDLSLKLRAAHHQCLWASAIEMLAPDDAVGEPEYWLRTGSLVDRWGFQRKWSALFAQARA